MRRYADDDEVDIVDHRLRRRRRLSLAQRLARAGWRVVVLETGPVLGSRRATGCRTRRAPSTSTGTMSRIIGGDDPVEMGKNNSGHGVGGSMVHYAGYTPRFHPSDFEARTRDGVGADWPISYRDLRAHYERVERELPVAGQDWPWGDPHSYPHSPHPICGAAERAWAGAREARDRDARRAGRDRKRRVRQPTALHLPRLLPAGLQGERQGEPARHARPRRDRARRRDPSGLHGRADRGRRVRAGERRHLPPRRARALPARRRRWPCAATRSRSPRLLLHSSSARFPHGLGQRTTTRSAAT